MVTIGFGSPYLVEHFPQAETWLAAFGISDVAQISVARALFGEIPVHGTLARDGAWRGDEGGIWNRSAGDPMTVQPMEARARKRSCSRRTT